MNASMRVFGNWEVRSHQDTVEVFKYVSRARLQPDIGWKDNKMAGCSVELGAQIYAKVVASRVGGAERVDAFVTWEDFHHSYANHR